MTVVAFRQHPGALKSFTCINGHDRGLFFYLSGPSERKGGTILSLKPPSWSTAVDFWHRFLRRVSLLERVCPPREKRWACRTGSTTPSSVIDSGNPKDPLMPVFAILVAIATAAGWIWGEVNNKPWIRRICGPAFTAILVIMASAVAIIETSFDDAHRNSGAVKDFVSALVASIDRGDTEAAHQELRRFDSESIQTYEGGALLRWLRDSVERLEAKNHVNGRMTIENASDKLSPDAEP